MNLQDRVGVVLVEPSEGGNVGSAARALKNMGFSSFGLVCPAEGFREDAQRLAVHAADLVENAQIFSSVSQAIQQAAWVVGVSGRTRAYPERKPPMGPGPFLEQLSALPAPGKAVLLFGPERTGLTNEHLALCHDILRLPTAPECPSLNLAHAVLLVAWEIRKRELTEATPEQAKAARETITTGELEGLMQHARRTLEVIGFLNPQNPEWILRDLRQVFARADLDARELSVLRGLFHRMDVWISRHDGPAIPNDSRQGKP